MKLESIVEELNARKTELESRLEELAQMRKALQRRDEGVYQSCAHCGGERLEAISYADSCIGCAA